MTKIQKCNKVRIYIICMHIGFFMKEENTGLLLWQVSVDWRRGLEAALAPLDLTHTQYILLSTINSLTSQGEYSTQREIAQEACLDITMTSQTLRTLEQKGFIERHYQEGNERSKFPILTDDGHEVLEQANAVADEVDSLFFRGLKANVKRFTDVLEKLR